MLGLKKGAGPSCSTRPNKVSFLISKKVVLIFFSFVDTLLHFWCYQALMDGCVQTDPHPGNFVIMEGNRMGCIDFGQVKRVDLRKRIAFAKMLMYSLLL